MTVKNVYAALRHGACYEDIIPYYVQHSGYETRELVAATFQMALERLPLPPEDEALRLVREVLSGEAWSKLYKWEEDTAF